MTLNKHIQQNWLLIFVGIALFLFTTPPNAQALNAELEKSILKEDYEQVYTITQQLLQSALSEKEKQEVKYYEALSLLRMHKFIEARQIFEDLKDNVRDKDLRDKVYLGLFDSYYMAEDYGKALPIIKEALRGISKTERRSLFYLKYARVNLRLANWKKANEYLQKIIAEYPNSLEAHIARQLLEEEQFFAVQIGAFIDQERAEKMVAHLQKQNEYAYIVQTTDRRNRNFYRVRVGKMSSLSDAQKLKSKLAKFGYPTEIYP